MLNILLSKRTADKLKNEIGEALGSLPYQLVSPETASASALLEIAPDIAFISRDVTGPSTKTQTAPETKRFYDCLKAAPSLKWVQIHSAGADRPVYTEFMAQGAVVTTASGATAPVVAHTALGGVLSLARRFPELAAAQRDRSWRPLLGNAPRSLVGQTALIVGYGPIGQLLHRYLDMLEMKVIIARREGASGADSTNRAGDINGFGGAPEVIRLSDIKSHLPRCDWVLLACPLTPLTRGLIDAEALSLMPAHGHLINVARGEVVIEADLIDALQNRVIAGAFLDVFTREPSDEASPLWALPNVIVSPHSAGISSSNEDAVARIWLDNLRRWSRGEPLINRAMVHPS